MPKLRVCGRAWAIGTDDFVMPSALSMYFRLLSLAFLITIIILLHLKLLKCDQPYFYLSLYLYGCLGITGVIIVVDVIVFCLSRRGGIMDEYPRRHIPAFFILRCVLCVVEFGWTGMGTFVVSYKFPCELALHVLMILWVVLSWFVFVLFLIGMMLIFDPLGATPCDCEEYPVHASKIWKTRVFLLRMLMCRYKYYEEFEDVARLFQTEFRHNELALSDVTAGLILLARKHHVEAERFFNEADNFALEEQLSVEDAERVMHFFKFASAAYGWPNYVIEDRSHLSEICCALSCQDVGYTNLVSREGECACHYNSRTVLNKAQIKRPDLIMISFKNTIAEVPFYVCMDHESKSVVVGVRGTQSLADTITDMIIHPAPIGWGYPDTFCAHKGMLAAANFVFAKIQRTKCFDYCFEKWPNYKVVVVGHSLGAGVACLVGFIMRQQEFLKERNVTCYTYAPPGVLLSEEASNFSRTFIYSGVVERDIVPRFSLGAMRRLERELNEVLHESTENKSKIIFGTIAGCVGKAIPCCCCFKKKVPVRRASYVPGDEVCVNVNACKDEGHKCCGADGVKGHDLVQDDCNCHEEPVDNSRADSHVLPHEFHNASLQIDSNAIDVEQDEVLKKSVVDSNLVYENSNDAGTGVKFKSDSTSHAATQKWRSSTGSRVSSIIGRILRGEDVGKKHFQYVPKREPDDVQIGHTMPLFPPGVFLYFEPCHPSEDKTVMERNGKNFSKLPHFINYVRQWKEFQYFWIKRSFFDRLFICDRMFTSHFPYTMDYAIVLGQPRIDVMKPKTESKDAELSEAKDIAGSTDYEETRDNLEKMSPRPVPKTEVFTATTEVLDPDNTSSEGSEEEEEEEDDDYRDRYGWSEEIRSPNEKSVQTMSITTDVHHSTVRLSDITERHEAEKSSNPASSNLSEKRHSNEEPEIMVAPIESETNQATSERQKKRVKVRKKRKCSDRHHLGSSTDGTNHAQSEGILSLNRPTHYEIVDKPNSN
ncbi:diacylglycerol lipase-beta-like isoform X2 [Convolutriloba macropyga]|uniref:diacylglycerol lipase-beta-like isoform X2 n=1 Tax=Convolutriloba macropyga TaxID=536237 RepID=UPI003F52451A